MKLVLASGSPRRTELLAALGVQFEVRPADVDESSDEPEPARLAEELALRKARAVARTSESGTAVLGADTIVVLGRRVFGKPADADEARTALTALRARTHEVISGVAVVVVPESTGRSEAGVRVGKGASAVVPLAPAGRGDRGERLDASDVAVTRVTMRDYSDTEIEAFIATGVPFDKSGAYAVQHPTFAPAAAVDGCLCSVIGLPLWTARRLLRTAGIEATPPTLDRCAACPLRES